MKNKTRIARFIYEKMHGPYQMQASPEEEAKKGPGYLEILAWLVEYEENQDREIEEMRRRF